MISRNDTAHWLHLARACCVLTLLVTVLPGCRTYTERTSRAKALFESGRFEAAANLFEDTDYTGSTFLSGAEGGLAALMGGDLERAIDLLTRAAAFAEDVEDQSIADPTALAQTLTSWALSETAIDYKGEGYERVMVHACLGLSYLAQGSIDGLLVEVRRANALLSAEEKLYDTEYAAGGFGHFLSALGYELRGQYDEAYIDYYKLYEKGMALPLVQPAMIRSAKKARRLEDASNWIQQFGDVDPVPEDAAQVILIAGVGRGAEKVESRIDVPTSNGVFSWAVPHFAVPPQQIAELELQTADLRARSVILEDVASVAEKNLSDRLAMLSVKSAVRGALKKELAREMRKQHGEGAFAIAQIFAIATERADLRSWTTLPATWQAARTYPRPGLVDIQLHALGGESIYLGTYDMEPGETIFLLARTVGPRVFAQVIGGHRVDSEPAMAANPTLNQ